MRRAPTNTVLAKPAQPKRWPRYVETITTEHVSIVDGRPYTHVCEVWENEDGTRSRRVYIPPRPGEVTAAFEADRKAQEQARIRRINQTIMQTFTSDPPSILGKHYSMVRPKSPDEIRSEAGKGALASFAAREQNLATVLEALRDAKASADANPKLSQQGKAIEIAEKTKAYLAVLVQETKAIQAMATVMREAAKRADDAVKTHLRSLPIADAVLASTIQRELFTMQPAQRNKVAAAAVASKNVSILSALASWPAELDGGDTTVSGSITGQNDRATIIATIRSVLAPTDCAAADEVGRVGRAACEAVARAVAVADEIIGGQHARGAVYREVPELRAAQIEVDAVFGNTYSNAAGGKLAVQPEPLGSLT